MNDGDIMGTMKKMCTSAVVGAALVGGLLSVGATPAAAATCPSAASPVISGAKAHWKLQCSGGNLKIYGWVEDTRPDGKCAKVDFWPGGYRMVCGYGDRANFDRLIKDTNSSKVTLSLS